MADNLKATDQEAFETELRNLFDYGDIKEVASEARIPYSSLTKQLNPDCIEESVPYQFLMFLYGCAKRRRELSDRVWSLVERFRPARRVVASVQTRFPSKLAFQVIETECNTPADELARIPYDFRVGQMNDFIEQMQAHRDRLAAENGSHYESATNFREGYGGGEGLRRATGEAASPTANPAASNGRR